jgi:hypothetical protein
MRISEMVMAIFIAGPALPIVGLYVLIGICAIGFSTGYALPWSIIPDAIDADYVKTGENREGVFYGIWTFCSKLGQALSALGIGALLSLAGIPPAAGFVGKFLLFRAAVNSGLTWLALIGGILWLAYAGGSVLPASATTTDQLSQPLGDIKSASVDLNAGTSALNVTALGTDSTDLMQGTFRHAENTRPVKTFNTAGSADVCRHPLKAMTAQAPAASAILA